MSEGLRRGSARPAKVTSLPADPVARLLQQERRRWHALLITHDAWLDAVVADLDGTTTPAAMAAVAQHYQQLADYLLLVDRLRRHQWPAP